MTPEELHQAEFLLGPWVSLSFWCAIVSDLTFFQLVGCYFDAFLQGILCCQVRSWPTSPLSFFSQDPQFNNYFRHYPEDKKRLKIAVAGLAFLTTLKTVHCLWVLHSPKTASHTNFLQCFDLDTANKAFYRFTGCNWFGLCGLVADGKSTFC